MIKNKGITLIALVITIIVLLILAGVSIATLTGENGLISKANEAKDKTVISEIEEQIELAKVASMDTNGQIIKQKLKTELEKIKGIDKIKENLNGIEVEYKGKKQVITTTTERVELGETELEEIANNIIAENEGQDYIIGIDIYGNQVNLDNWYYVHDQQYGGYFLMYAGGVENDTIIGEIPAYIISNQNSTLTRGLTVGLESAFSPDFNAEMRNLKVINVAFPKTVKYWAGAFRNSGITNIPRNINIDKAELMGVMFQNCTEITEIPQSFNLANASNLRDVINMFDGCTGLTKIAEGFELPVSITSTEKMFQNCTGITEIPQSLNLARLSKLFKTSWMFAGCTELTTIPEGFALPSSVNYAQAMFRGTKIKKIPDSFNLVDTSLRQCVEMFSGCTELTTLPEGFALPQTIIDASLLFKQTNISTVPESFNLANLPNLEACERMFTESNIETLPNNFALSDSIINCSAMFFLCRNLQSIPDTFVLGDNVERCDSLFGFCKKIEHLPANFRIPPKVTDINTMFQQVKYAYFENLIIPENVTNISNTFQDMGIQGQITIQGNPTEYTNVFRYTSQSCEQPIIVNYTNKCTNIESIKATMEYSKVEFKLI